MCVFVVILQASWSLTSHQNGSSIRDVLYCLCRIRVEFRISLSGGRKVTAANLQKAKDACQTSKTSYFIQSSLLTAKDHFEM